MKYELNKNDNSKKLVIGVSILFCTVILIIGVTTAYFTQSGVGDTGNIVTSNINGTIGFTNNNDYMRNNLIPVKESDVSLFATKNSVNSSGKYTNEDICLYQDDMYACSLYEFTITNNANVTQDMKITLTPYPNQFTNLYYLVYESEQLGLNTNSKVVKKATHIDKENASTMIESVTLKPEESKTYTVVFYIKAMGYDQTGEDANKRFGAIVRIDSITTGAYKNIVVGSTCYEFEELNDETLMLTKFNGIDVNGNVDAGCGVTKSEDGFYSIIVPSTIGGTRVSTLGSTLFIGVDLSTFQMNSFSKIDNIVVEEGITNIESGEMAATFVGVGASSITIDESTGAPSGATYYDREISISLPSTLTNIGDYTFAFSGINDYRFNLDENNNSSIEKIGKHVFILSNISNITLPEGIKTIDAYAFQFSNLSDIVLPSSLEIIGDYAFHDCNLTTDKNNPLIIPYSVNYIGENAFYNNFNLTKLEFAGSHTDVYDNLEDERYNLLTIGNSAFYGDGLDYSGNEELILPARVSSIGGIAFQGNPGDPIQNTLKNIRYMGSRDRLNSLGTSWYHGGVSVKAYGE